MTNSSSGGKSNRGSNKRKQRRRQQPKQQQQLASTKGISDFNLGLAWNYRQARNIAGECLVVRNSATSTRRYLSLLFLESLYYFYLNVGLFHSREEAQKGEIFRDPEPIVVSNRGGNDKQQQRRRQAKATEAIKLAISQGSVSWSETRPLGDICRFSF